MQGLVIVGDDAVTHLIHDPMPGVWEIRLSDVADTQTFDWEQARKPDPVPPTAARLVVSTHAVEVGSAGAVPDVAPVDRATIGSPGEVYLAAGLRERTPTPLTLV